MRTTKEITAQIVTVMTKLNRYDPALDFQIMSLAGAIRSFEIATADIDSLDCSYVSEKSRYGNDSLSPHPAFKIQKDAMDQVTRQMKALGLTQADLGSGVATDPLIELTKEVIEGARQGKKVKPKKDLLNR